MTSISEPTDLPDDSDIASAPKLPTDHAAQTEYRTYGRRTFSIAALLERIEAAFTAELRPETLLGATDDVTRRELIREVADYVLIMSVNPGFEGQKFIPNALQKIRRLDTLRRERHLEFSIEIDGGVSAVNTAEIVDAGCNWLVAGSAIFHSEDPAAAVLQMQQLARSVRTVRV